jgi:hypothetical protein
MANITREDVDKVHELLSTIVEWSGATDDTPDDTEVVYINGKQLTLGDIREAVGTLNSLADMSNLR